MQQRSYFDQASVLKQIGILPQSLFCKANGLETTLPVMNGRIADLVKGTGLLNTLIGNETSAGLTTAQANEINSLRSKKGSAAPSHGILPQSREEEVENPRRGRNTSSKPVQGIVPVGNEQVHNHRPVQATGKGVSGVFGGPSEPEVTRSSTRVHQAPGGKWSVASCACALFGLEGALGLCLLTLMALCILGETRYNIFAEEPSLPIRTNISVDPQRNKSHVNIFDASKDEPSLAPQQAGNKRDPNWSSSVDVESANTPSTPHSARKMNPNAQTNKSHFDIGGGKPEADDEGSESLHHHGRKLFSGNNTSSIVFGDVGSEKVRATGISRHDPNARSEESSVYDRPSSR